MSKSEARKRREERLRPAKEAQAARKKAAEEAKRELKPSSPTADKEE